MNLRSKQILAAMCVASLIAGCSGGKTTKDAIQDTDQGVVQGDGTAPSTVQPQTTESTTVGGDGQSTPTSPSDMPTDYIDEDEQVQPPSSTPTGELLPGGGETGPIASDINDKLDPMGYPIMPGEADPDDLKDPGSTADGFAIRYYNVTVDETPQDIIGRVQPYLAPGSTRILAGLETVGSVPFTTRVAIVNPAVQVNMGRLGLDSPIQQWQVRTIAYSYNPDREARGGKVSLSVVTVNRQDDGTWRVSAVAVR